MDNPPAASPDSRSVLLIVVIAILAVLMICIVIPICVIVILALLGPSIGNVFSNIIQNLPTATPFD